MITVTCSLLNIKKEANSLSIKKTDRTANSRLIRKGAINEILTPIHPRTHSHLLAEEGSEVIVIGETNILSGFARGSAHLLHEHGSLLDSHAIQMLDDRFSYLLLEQMRQSGRRQHNGLCQVLNLNAFRHTFMQKIQNILYSWIPLNDMVLDGQQQDLTDSMFTE